MDIVEVRRRLEQMRVTVTSCLNEIDALIALIADDTSATTLLNVPYLSQWDKPGTIGAVRVDADRSPGDCGPACVTMLIHYLTKSRPTVDEVAIEAGQPVGGHYTSLAQLVNAAACHDVALEIKCPLTLDAIREELDCGNPVLLLVHYGALSGRQDVKYRAGHFVLVTGYGLDTQGEYFLLNDPDWWGDKRAEGNHWRVSAIDLAIAMAQCNVDGNRNNQGLTVK